MTGTLMRPWAVPVASHRKGDDSAPVPAHHTSMLNIDTPSLSSPSAPRLSRPPIFYGYHWQSPPVQMHAKTKSITKIKQRSPGTRTLHLQSMNTKNSSTSGEDKEIRRRNENAGHSHWTAACKIPAAANLACLVYLQSASPINLKRRI